MTDSHRTLWVQWAVFAGLLALELALPRVLPARPEPWYEAQQAVAGFVLALLSLLAAVGTFTLRESLLLRDLRRGTLDPRSPAGFARVRATLFALWALCGVIGALGCVLAWGAASPRAAWPYIFAAAVLLGLHSPRHWLFAGPSPDAS